MAVIAVYPGSFDPITNGHIDLVERGAEIFDLIIVSVADNVDKEPLFTVKERAEMIREIFKGRENIQVDSFRGLLVDYLKKVKANVVLRGLRAVSDFDYEAQMALTNKKMYPPAETFFLMSGESYTYLSSSIVREIAMYGGHVEGMVPKLVENLLKDKYQKRRDR